MQLVDYGAGENLVLADRQKLQIQKGKNLHCPHVEKNPKLVYMLYMITRPSLLPAPSTVCREKVQIYITINYKTRDFVQLSLKSKHMPFVITGF